MSSISNVFGAGGASGMANVTTLTPNSGGSVSPILGNINIIPTPGAAGVLNTINGGLNNLDIGFTASTNGQLIIGATAGNPAWATLTAGSGISITNAANSITIALTAIANTVTYTPVNFAASPYSTLTTDYYIGADVTGGAITIRLPNTPATGRIYAVKDVVGLAATNNITVTTSGGAVNIDGATTFVMNTAYESIQLIFNGTSYEIY